MTLLIDADYLIYSSCCAAQHDIRYDKYNHQLIMYEREAMIMIDIKLKVSMYLLTKLYPVLVKKV